MSTIVTAPMHERPTESFRREHVEVKRHLTHVGKRVAELPSLEPSSQRSLMDEVVTELERHLVPHAQWEDHVLYTLVDEKSGNGRLRVTASMRHEHLIVGRWIGMLRDAARSPDVDPGAFVRHVDRLLGLVLAHFECEEEVLLPLLDRTMTRDDFERLVGGAHPH